MTRGQINTCTNMNIESQCLQFSIKRKHATPVKTRMNEPRVGDPVIYKVLTSARKPDNRTRRLALRPSRNGKTVHTTVIIRRPLEFIAAVSRAPQPNCFSQDASRLDFFFRGGGRGGEGFGFRWPNDKDNK